MVKYNIPYSTKAQREELTLFSKIFHSSPSPIAIISMETGSFIEANHSFLQVTGYSLNEVLGLSPVELNIWPNTEEHQKLFNLIAENGSVQNLQMDFRTKHGLMRTGMFTAEIITLDGEPCIMGLMKDITEQIQLEKEIQRLEQLHLIGKMAASIAHEIRNPMTSVRGFLQLMNKRENNIKTKEYFDIMISELDRANKIITEFLSLAKYRNLDYQRQNLNTIIDNLSSIIESDALNSGMEINYELNDIPTLLMDKNEISQLILNLVRNGFEAMSPGGMLVISTYTTEDKIILAIKDQGNGFDPEILKNIGNPFLTTKEHGTGLGLSVCFSIALRHNAGIYVESCSKGTSVNVEFNLQ